jgi:uncharacterized DUF497 family protein
MFEWDDAKRLENLRDHGVDFRYALRIFDNPTLEAEDGRSDYGEKRIRALGYVEEDEFYLVAYTWRGENQRIISAWKVGDDGKRRYTALLSRGT